MRIFANFTPLIRFLLWIMFVMSIAVVAVSIVILCGVVLPGEISRGQATLLLFAFSLDAVIAVLMSTIHYQVTETHLRLKIAFFDILSGRIRLENILNIVYKVETDEKHTRKMYISYLWKSGDPIIAQIVIKPKNFDKMKEALMSKNANIVFWDDEKQQPEN